MPVLAPFAALARVDERDVYAATLAAFDGTALDLTGLDPVDRHSYRQVAARGWAPAHGTQICPMCLAEDRAWQGVWRLLIVTSCIGHESLLVARCPSCRRPFRDQRHSHLRRVGASLVCGNPLGAGPTTQCPHDLTATPTTPASYDVLTLQTRVDTALSGQEVTVLGQAASQGPTSQTSATSPRFCSTSPDSPAPLSWRPGWTTSPTKPTPAAVIVGGRPRRRSRRPQP